MYCKIKIKFSFSYALSTLIRSDHFVFLLLICANVYDVKKFQLWLNRMVIVKWRNHLLLLILQWSNGGNCGVSEKKSKLYLRSFFRTIYQRLIVPVKSIYIIMTLRSHVQTKRKRPPCHCTKTKEFFITKKKEVCRSKSKNGWSARKNLTGRYYHRMADMHVDQIFGRQLFIWPTIFGRYIDYIYIVLLEAM